MRIRILLSLALLGFSFSANATVIGFEEITGTSSLAAGNQPTNPNSRVSDFYQNDGVIFGRAGVSTGVAVVDAGANGQTGNRSAVGMDNNNEIPGTASGAAIGDIYFNFVVPGTTIAAAVDSLNFSFGIGDGGGDLDEWIIRAYDIGDSLIETQNVSSNNFTTVNMTANGIHRVEIDFQGTFGYIFDQLSFDETTLAAAPEPGMLLLLLSGMIGLGRIRRKV